MPQLRILRPLALAPAVLSGLLLAGCSAPAPAVTVTVAPGAASAGDASAAPSITAATRLTTAYQLLTRAEAEAVVGTTLSAAQEGDPLNPSCTYNPDPDSRTAQVTVTTGDGAKKTYDIDESLEHPFTDVAGIGDEAHQEESAIYFRKGATWAGISVVTLDDPATMHQQMQDAAKVVVSRLP